MLLSSCAYRHLCRVSVWNQVSRGVASPYKESRLQEWSASKESCKPASMPYRPVKHHWLELGSSPKFSWKRSMRMRASGANAHSGCPSHRMTNLVISSIQVMGNRITARGIIIVIRPLSDRSDCRSHAVSKFGRETGCTHCCAPPDGRTHSL